MAQAEIEPLAAPTVDIRDLSFAYDKQPVLQNIDLEITEGSVVMIIGRSGGGKTTLLRLIGGLLQSTQGEIKLFGEELQRKKHACDPRTAYIPQQLGLVRSFSVETNTLTGALSRVNTLLSLFKIFPKNIRLEADAKLEKLGIAHKAREAVHNLSGGERQRVAIGRALMQQAKVILADEFVSQLDPVTTKEIMEIVRKLAKESTTFIIATHELSVLRHYGQRVILLRNGQKVGDAEAGQLSNDQVMALMR